MIPNFVIVVSGKGSIISDNRIKGAFGVNSAKRLVDSFGFNSVRSRTDGREGRRREGGRGEEKGGGDELHGDFSFGRCAKKVVQRIGDGGGKRRYSGENAISLSRKVSMTIVHGSKKTQAFKAGHAEPIENFNLIVY